MRADITDEADVAAKVDRAITEFGQVDILLNNAAAPGQDRFVWDQTLDNWNATIATVLTGTMLECKSGSIVDFSSTASWGGLPRKSHYVAAKAGVRALTKAIALKGRAMGVRCNCIVPGSIDTVLWRN